MAELCTLKSALLLEYTNAAKLHAETIADLHKSLGTIDREEYERLSRVAEEARLSVEAARLNMEVHVKKHGC